MTVKLKQLPGGISLAPHARLIDRSGLRRLAIGDGEFVSAVSTGTIVDKTLLIADILASGYKATLFCRPRRFGKTLNITMLKAFLESPDAGGLKPSDAVGLFAGTEIWEADEGAYQPYQGAYPVVHLSLSSAARESWAASYGAIKDAISTEYLRHNYLREQGGLIAEEESFFGRIASKQASPEDESASLTRLCRMLASYHKTPVVLLVDEYDAPVMAAHTHRYYDEAVSFMRGWLTGAVKDGGTALAFSCLTGVQRISKESIFSGLNNLTISTPLTVRFDERYGFTEAEVEALATYLGHPECMPEAREWYDGYRFGRMDVYNPWSVINYFDQGCQPGAYWGNTSGNSVIGELVTNADAETLEDVYALIRPGGVTYTRLDQGVVFPELGLRAGALWSMLYLSGYLTTDDTEDPNDDMRLRPMRVPNKEVSRLFRNEVLRRFIGVAGGERRLATLHRSLLAGDDAALTRELTLIASRASYLDLTSELACHMLLMGLLFGVPGYEDPLSNREEGNGRYDIQLAPYPASANAHQHPLVTIEVKYRSNASKEGLAKLAQEALGQIERLGYDTVSPMPPQGRLRWGIAFCHKAVACVSQHL